MIGAVLHLSVAVAYGTGAAWLAAVSRGRRAFLLLALFCLLSALWGGMTALGAAGASVPLWAASAGELLRLASGCAVLLLLLAAFVPNEESGSWQGTLWIALGLLSLLAAIDIALPVSLPGHSINLRLGLIAMVGLPVLGLLAVENAFRHGRELRWNVKHLLIAQGGIFAFDLFFFADAFLMGGTSPRAALFRPVVATVMLPLMLLSARRLNGTTLEIAISRDVVFHSTALIVCGLYLVAVSLAGLLLQGGEESWTAVVQFFFLLAAVLALTVILLSGEAKARLRHMVSRHLFRLAFDYRREWLRFIDTMARGQGDASLQHRAVRALADVFECSGGALFLHSRGDAFVQSARFKWSSAASLLALPAPLVALLRHEGTALDLRDASIADKLADPAIAAWLGHLEDPWLLLPIRWQAELLGVCVLAQPKVPRRLTWEDRDLLGVLAAQVASHLREDQASRALMVAQRFERTGRHFTFIAHDIKNVVSQLGLVARQAERHGGNPQFVADAFATVRDSVDRMKGLLVKLRDNPDGSVAPPPAVALDGVLADIVERKRRIFPRIDLTVAPGLPLVQAAPDGLVAVIENALQNAFEAGATMVSIVAAQLADGPAITIADNGPGMPPALIESLLFSPFSSTKSSGFGIGMFQSRAVVEEWGGRLTVDSRPGEGTSVRLSLPPALPLAKAQ